MANEFQPRQLNSGSVIKCEKGYRLQLEKMEKVKYSLAQIDDYMHLRRSEFLHAPPVILRLEARLSDQIIPGTWGFGFWNDPFGLGFGGGGRSRMLPVLPNAAWFFFGSEENGLSLRDDLPGNGFHMKTFRSPLLPSFMSLISLPFAPLLFLKSTARLLRRSGRIFIKEDGKHLDLDVEQWHEYRLMLGVSEVTFFVDDFKRFSTTIVPRGRTGIVIWMDNQYFRFDKSGEIHSGYLRVQKKQWMDICNMNFGEKED